MTLTLAQACSARLPTHLHRCRRLPRHCSAFRPLCSLGRAPYRRSCRHGRPFPGFKRLHTVRSLFPAPSLQRWQLHQALGPLRCEQLLRCFSRAMLLPCGQGALAPAHLQPRLLHYQRAPLREASHLLRSHLRLTRLQRYPQPMLLRLLLALPRLVLEVMRLLALLCLLRSLRLRFYQASQLFPSRLTSQPSPTM